MRRFLLLWFLALPLVAQTEFDAFDLAYEQARESEPDRRTQLAARASNLFLRLSPDTPGRRARLASGIAATLWAGRTAAALELVGSGTAEDLRNGDFVTWQMITFVRNDLAKAFAGAMVAARARGQHAAVTTALTAEEGRLLPLADSALRRGESKLGRVVFEALAALEPPQAYRYANLGLCLRNLGETAEAERVYDRAVKLAPDDSQIENDRGLLLRALGQRQAALAAFRRSYALDEVPGAGPAVTNLLHFVAVAPTAATAEAPAEGNDPLPLASRALGIRPDAVMLRRLVVDVALDRLRKSASPRDR